MLEESSSPERLEKKKRERRHFFFHGNDKWLCLLIVTVTYKLNLSDSDLGSVLFFS